ncbi:MAG: ATP-dependent zinc metalloprotease FtsH [Lachnospiraceae bacterium]|nr:ATP-dependent zinc metalloprotease FtsH [Lachnospiraceae bacterium]
MSSQNNKDDGGGKLPKNSQGVLIMVIAAILTLFSVSLLGSMMDRNTEEITYNEFLDMVEAGKIKSVSIEESRSRLVVTPKTERELAAEQAKGEKETDREKKETESSAPDLYDYYMSTAGSETFTVVMAEESDQLVPRLRAANVEFKGVVPDSSSAILDFLLIYVFPIILVWVVLMVFMRRTGGGGVMGVGKSNAKVYVQKATGVTFKDVAGQDEAKESLTEIVDFLHNPARYVEIGAKLPKGALLVGPPGTGKTLLAKAVAGEANVPFFSLSGSDFVEMFVGVGASRVRDLFKQAQQNAPCIIFIDEIDAIGKSRDSRYGGGNDEREQTLNQLLSEMDGFDPAKGVFILAATNRPEILDKALLRPGRFDRRIIVDRPDLKGRINTLKVHSKNVALDDTVDLEAIALATSGAVGSDLANMINEAAINAVKSGRKVVSQSDLFDAVEQVLVGKEKKDRVMSAEERKIVSYHEVGHALISALQKDSEPVQKITIIPRTMGALGYVLNVPEEEKYLNSKAELQNLLVKYLGGRAAEELVFDTVTTGASNDIEKATSIARSMVTQYGMSSEFGLMGLESVENRYLDGRAVLNCADATAAGVDDVVMKMLKEAYEEAKRLLSENRKALDLIAGFLIKKETITGKEFMDIFHKVQNGEEVLLPEEREEDSEVPKDSEAVEFAEATERSEAEAIKRSEAEAIKRSEAVETSKATEIPEASEEDFTKEK